MKKIVLILNLLKTEEMKKHLKILKIKKVIKKKDIFFNGCHLKIYRCKNCNKKDCTYFSIALIEEACIVLSKFHLHIQPQTFLMEGTTKKGLSTCHFFYLLGHYNFCH